MEWMGLPGGAVRLRLDSADRWLLRELVHSVVTLLEPETAPAATDPALRRLLPDGVRDDPEAARDFRSLTEESVRSAKLESARRVLASIPGADGDGADPADDDAAGDDAHGERTDATSVELDREATTAWVATLNDVRLVVGTRLGVAGDREPADADGVTGGAPEVAGWALYQWLTEVQSVLVEGVLAADGG